MYVDTPAWYAQCNQPSVLSLINKYINCHNRRNNDFFQKKTLILLIIICRIGHVWTSGKPHDIKFVFIMLYSINCICCISSTRTFVLKIICKGRIHLLVFTRSGHNCVPLFKFSHEIVKSYINLVIKRGIYLNSRWHFPKPVLGFLLVDVRPLDIILAKQTNFVYAGS